MRSRSIVGLVLACGVFAAACSGGDDDAEDIVDSIVDTPTTDGAAVSTSTTDATDASTSSTTVPTESTLEITTTLAETTTTVAPPPTYPLTGLPLETPDDLRAYRAALVVKIDNHPQARPQSGLNQADLVYEENVENLTRFAAVFQSQDSDPVGPIRSGRTQDIDLLAALNRPLFAWSGGNPAVTRAIRSSDLIDLSWTVAGSQGGYRRIRSPGIDTEHTLYADTSKLFANFTPPYAPPPPPQFTYRAAGAPANGGTATGGAEVDMDNVTVTWTWDAATGQYLRAQGGRPHNDINGVQVNAANVVVLEVQYAPSPADRRSPEAQTLGTGFVHVLTGGVIVDGTWERADRLSPFVLKDANGAVIALAPGRTWIELSRVGSTTPI